MRKRILAIGLILAGCIALAVACGYWALAHRGFRAHREAEAAYAQGDWKTAKRSYGWYLARQPNDVAALERYAETALKSLDHRLTNVRDAARAYQKIAAIQQTNRDAAIRVTTFCEQHELWPDLEYCVRLFGSRYPGDAMFAYWGALARERQGDLNGALQAYEALFQSGSCPPKACGALAGLLVQLGFPEQARERLDQALERDKSNAILRAYRCMYFADRGELEDATGELAEAQKIDANAPEVLLATARLQELRAEWEAAAATVQKYIAARPDLEGYILACKAIAGTGTNREAEAIALLETADDYFFADHPQLYLLLADLQLVLHQFEDASATVGKYRSAYPEHTLALDYLDARQLEEKGQSSEAIAKLQMIVEQSPEMSLAVLHLVSAYLQTGDSDQLALAKGTLERYLAAHPTDTQARALWDAAFSSPTFAEAKDIADRLLVDKDATSSTMTGVARTLLENSDTEADADASRELARKLLEKARERDRDESGEPLLALVELNLKAGQLEQAKAILADAEKKAAEDTTGSATAPLGYTLARTLVALQERRLEDAQAYLQSDLSRKNLSRMEIGRWAQLFAANGYTDIGMQVLDKLQVLEPGAAGEILAGTQKITLALRAGDFRAATDLVQALEQKFAKEPAALQQLNQPKTNIAEALMKSGNPQDEENAERLIQEIRNTSPQDRRASILDVRLKLRHTPPDLEGAENICTALRNSGAADAEVFLVSADVATQKGEIGRAMDFAAQASSTSPGNAQALLALGQAQLRSGQFAGAILSLEKALSFQPRQLGIVDMLARAYAGAGKYDASDAMMKRLENETADSPERDKALVSLRTWIAICRKDWPTAEQLARSQYEANPADAGAIRNLIVSLTGQNRAGEAEALLESATPGTQLPPLWCELGACYLQLEAGRGFSGATRAFSKALSIDPDYIPARCGLIDVEIQSKNTGRALGLCNSVLSRSRDNVDVLERKAYLLTFVPTSADEALQTADRVLQLAPARPQALQIRGSLLLSKGRYGDAARDLQNAISLQGGTTARIEAFLAEAYHGLKEEELAEMHYNLAKQKAEQGEPVDRSYMQKLNGLFAGSKS